MNTERLRSSSKTVRDWEHHGLRHLRIGYPLEVHRPDEVDVELTLTEKATTMLEDAFGDDRSHALLVGVLSGDVQATCTTFKSWNQRTRLAKN